MKRASSIGFAISMAMFGGFAATAPDAAVPSPVVSLDGDNDQTVDISEMGKAASDSFDKIDSDGDGNVDRAALLIFAGDHGLTAVGARFERRSC